MSPEALATILATIVAAVITAGGSVAVVVIQRRRPASAEHDGREREKEPAPAPAPARVSRLERIKQIGQLRCGCIKHPPLCDFSYVNGRWEYTGLYVEMARAVAVDTGLDAVFTGVDWVELTDAFEQLKVDLVLSVLETRQRSTFGDFVCPFHKIGVSAVTQIVSDKVSSVTDLQRDDVRVVVTKGEVGWEYAALDLRIPRRRLLVIESSDLGEMMDYVMSGRADVAICDDVSCARCVETMPGLRRVFADDPLYLCRNAIMIPKGDPEFASWIDAQFSRVRASKVIYDLESAILSASNGLIRRFR